MTPRCSGLRSFCLFGVVEFARSEINFLVRATSHLIANPLAIFGSCRRGCVFLPLHFYGFDSD
jgi:hypothetical protein